MPTTTTDVAAARARTIADVARGLRTVAALLTAMLLAGLGACSWGSQEPGLFSTPGPSAPASPTAAPAVPPAPTNPLLPVLGDALWTTADGSGITVRFAVHAVRRTSDATVLDWSVTPLAGPGRRPGELIPTGTDLGLGRSLAGEQDITLLDIARGRAYHPLANVSPEQFSRCLCTPLYAVTPSLRFGDTRLLQVSYPALPDTDAVDVVFPNVEVVPGVPIAPEGSVPVAARATDLTRTAAAGNPVTGAKTYTSPDRSHRQETVVVNRVVASPGLTSVVWTLHSVDDEYRGFRTPGPPVSAVRLAGVRVQDDVPASGPRVRLGGSGQPPTGVRWTTASYSGLPTYECLCSSLGLWSKALRHAGGSAHLASQVGPIPPGTKRVEVLFPGLTAFTDVAVTWVADVADTTTTYEMAPSDTWTYHVSEPPIGWPTTAWPTPLPAPDQVEDYASRPERVLPELPRS